MLSQLIKRLFSVTVIPKEVDYNLSSVASKAECVNNQSYSPVPSNWGGGGGGVLIKGGGPNKKVGGRGLKLFSVRSGNPLPLFMGIALAKSQSARRASHQLAFMVQYLTISHTCLLSHVFASDF